MLEDLKEIDTGTDSPEIEGGFLGGGGPVMDQTAGGIKELDGN